MPYRHGWEESERGVYEVIIVTNAADARVRIASGEYRVRHGGSVAPPIAWRRIGETGKRGLLWCDKFAHERLRPKVAVEEQRVVSAPVDRKVVFPRIAVAEPPCRDARHGGMPLEEPEESHHAAVPGSAHRVGKPVGIRIEPRLVAGCVGHVGALACRWQRAHVPLGYHHLATGGRKGIHALLEVTDAGVVHAYVGLHAYCVNAQSAPLQPLHHAHHGLALAPAGHTVVVVIKLSIWVGGVGVLKSQGYVFLSQYLVKGCLAV